MKNAFTTINNQKANTNDQSFGLTKVNSKPKLKKKSGIQSSYKKDGFSPKRIKADFSPGLRPS